MASIFGANMGRIKARRDIYTKSSKFMTTNFLSAPGQIESGGVLHFDHIIFLIRVHGLVWLISFI